MKSQLVIANSVLDKEDMMAYQWTAMQGWLDGYQSQIKGALEGISFAAKGSSKDFLCGIQWHFRAAFKARYDSYLGVIPVTSWRCKVLTPLEQAEAKAFHKDGLKIYVVNKLPVDVKERFEEYLKFSKIKASSIQDLADAYFIAQYRRSLG